MQAHTGNDAAAGLTPQADTRNPRTFRPGVVLAVVVAALASAGLAWWLAVAPDQTLRVMPGAPQPSASAAAPAPPPQAFADPQPNADQVRRAYEELQDTYADGGLAAVRHSADICAGSLAANPQVLDYCLAFSLYADALQPGRDSAGARLAMARQALPTDSDPKGRIAEVGVLTRTLTESASQPASGRAAAQKSPARAGASKTAVRARPAASRRANRPAATSACRLRSTPTERALCASPALQAADRQMRAAYNRALAAGANRRALARDQARWKVQANAASADRRRLAALYAQRTHELRDAARRR